MAAKAGAGSTSITNAPATAATSIAPSTEPVARASCRLRPAGASKYRRPAFMALLLSVDVRGGFREEVGLAVGLFALGGDVAVGALELADEPRRFADLAA